jgi:hypothetical protein
MSATYSSVQSLFQNNYGPYMNPLPSENTIAERAAFVPSNLRGGLQYYFPIRVGVSQGVTHNIDNSAFALNTAIDTPFVNAQLDGATILVRENLSYDIIAKSMNGDASYKAQMDLTVESLSLGGELFRELNLLYGPGTASTAAANVGVVNASVSGANLAAPQIVNVTEATWAAGIWNMFAPNGIVDIYQSDGLTLRAAEVTVQAVVSATNRLQLYKAGSSATVAQGDIIVLRGQVAKGCYGLQSILENDGSLFGLSAATYPMWKSVEFSAGSAALTTTKIQQLMSRLKNNGLKATNGKAGTLFVSAATFADLIAELQGNTATNPGGNRWNDGATGGPKTVGTDNIMVNSPCGIVDIAIHSYMKQGLAMFLPEGKVKRVGSTDITFSLPGTNKWFYTELTEYAGCQIRVFSNQAPVIEVPYHAGIISGIVNAASTAPA